MDPPSLDAALASVLALGAYLRLLLQLLFTAQYKLLLNFGLIRLPLWTTPLAPHHRAIDRFEAFVVPAVGHVRDLGAAARGLRAWGDAVHQEGLPTWDALPGLLFVLWPVLIAVLALCALAVFGPRRGLTNAIACYAVGISAIPLLYSQGAFEVVSLVKAKYGSFEMGDTDVRDVALAVVCQCLAVVRGDIDLSSVRALTRDIVHNVLAHPRIAADDVARFAVRFVVLALAAQVGAMVHLVATWTLWTLKGVVCAVYSVLHNILNAVGTVLRLPIVACAHAVRRSPLVDPVEVADADAGTPTRDVNGVAPAGTSAIGDVELTTQHDATPSPPSSQDSGSESGGEISDDSAATLSQPALAGEKDASSPVGIQPVPKPDVVYQTAMPVFKTALSNGEAPVAAARASYAGASPLVAKIGEASVAAAHASDVASAAPLLVATDGTMHKHKPTSSSALVKANASEGSADYLGNAASAQAAGLAKLLPAFAQDVLRFLAPYPIMYRYAFFARLLTHGMGEDARNARLAALAPPRNGQPPIAHWLQGSWLGNAYAGAYADVRDAAQDFFTVEDLIHAQVFKLVHGLFRLCPAPPGGPVHAEMPRVRGMRVLARTMESPVIGHKDLEACRGMFRAEGRQGRVFAAAVVQSVKFWSVPEEEARPAEVRVFDFRPDWQDVVHRFVREEASEWAEAVREALEKDAEEAAEKDDGARAGESVETEDGALSASSASTE
ncbi:hypothetical protein HDZ31DRAFT_76992, partial [Schizophyllum fasciatum]